MDTEHPQGHASATGRLLPLASASIACGDGAQGLGPDTDNTKHLAMAMHLSPGKGGVAYCVLGLEMQLLSDRN